MHLTSLRPGTISENSGPSRGAGRADHHQLNLADQQDLDGWSRRKVAFLEGGRVSKGRQSETRLRRVSDAPFSSEEGTGRSSSSTCIII